MANKRKRTARRRAALWGGSDPTYGIDLDADMVLGRAGEDVFARGVVTPDDGLNFKRLFPDQWEAMHSAISAQKAPFFAASVDDGGGGYARFRADMARTQALGLAPTDLDGAAVMRITRADQ